MRGAPQVAFSATIRKIKARTSLLTCFRPPICLTLETHAQYKRNPARCQFTTVLVELVVAHDDCRAISSMEAPPAAFAFRPCVSDEEDEAVDEAELGRERQVRLKAFSRALRDVAQPPGGGLPAHFPWKLAEHLFPDGSGAVVRFVPYGKA